MGDVTLPRFAEHSGTGGAGEFLRAIADLLVQNDNDLTGPAGHAGKRARQARDFIAGNQADGYGKGLTKCHTGSLSHLMEGGKSEHPGGRLQAPTSKLQKKGKQLLFARWKLNCGQ